MAETRYEFEKRIRAEGAKMREASRIERIKRTKNITDRWNIGFKILKEENDRLQAELKDWWELDQLQIRNYVIENLERGHEFKWPG